jgi:hypothetical protein
MLTRQLRRGSSATPQSGENRPVVGLAELPDAVLSNPGGEVGAETSRIPPPPLPSSLRSTVYGVLVGASPPASGFVLLDKPGAEDKGCTVHS